MRLMRGLAASLLALGAAGDAFAEEAENETSPRLPLGASLNKELIKNAVKDTLAAEPKSRHSQLDDRVLRGDSYEKFARKFSEAEVPNCLRPDALKHQPTSVEYKGWVFGVAGLPSVPFWMFAAASGKCHMSFK